MSEKQWVNLEKMAAYLGSTGAADLHQLGKVKPKLRFAKAIQGAAKVRVVEEQDNLTYSEAELDRNESFRLLAGGKTFKELGTDTFDSDVEIRLRAAGGKRYRFEALNHDGSVIRSPTVVEAHRCVQYQVFATKSVFAEHQARIGKIFKPVHDCFAKQGRNVSLVRVDPDGDPAPRLVTEVTARTNRGQSEGALYATMQAEVLRVGRRAPKKVTIPILFVPYLATRETAIFTTRGEDIVLSARKGITSWGLQWKLKGPPWRLHLELPASESPLFYGVDEFEPECEFLRELRLSWRDGSFGPLAFNGTHARVEGRFFGRYGGYRAFSVDLGAATGLEEALKKSVQLELEVALVTGFTVGLHVRPGLIMIAMRGGSLDQPFRDTTNEELSSVIVHELGHAMGLAANGDRTKTTERQPLTPDAGAHYYDHTTEETLSRGPHCRAHSSKEFTCSMYGLVNEVNDFCPECAVALRKSDLSDLGRFSR